VLTHSAHSLTSFSYSWQWYNKNKRTAAAAKREDMTEQIKDLQSTVKELQSKFEQQEEMIMRLQRAASVKVRSLTAIRNTVGV